jgi:hypothetical protein
MSANNILDDGKRKAVIFHLRSGTTIRVPCMGAEIRFDGQSNCTGYSLVSADGVLLFLDIKEVVAVTIDWMNDECPKAL